MNIIEQASIKYAKEKYSEIVDDYAHEKSDINYSLTSVVSDSEAFIAGANYQDKLLQTEIEELFMEKEKDQILLKCVIDSIGNFMYEATKQHHIINDENLSFNWKIVNLLSFYVQNYYKTEDNWLYSDVRILHTMNNLNHYFENEFGRDENGCLPNEDLANCLSYLKKVTGRYITYTMNPINTHTQFIDFCTQLICGTNWGSAVNIFWEEKKEEKINSMKTKNHKCFCGHNISYAPWLTTIFCPKCRVKIKL